MELLDDERDIDGEVSDKALSYMLGNVLWMRFVSIFWLAVLTVLALYNLMQTFRVISMYQSMDIDIPSYLYISLFLQLLFFIGMIIIYIVLFQTASSFANFAGNYTPETFESAMKMQQRFWTLFSVYLIVSLVLGAALFFFLMSRSPFFIR